MRATLLHLAYEDHPESAADRLTMMASAARRPVEEVRRALHRLLAAGRYWAVGEFESSDPARIWFLAQNGTASPSWSREPPDGVVPLGDGTVFGGLGYRSTSAGDVVVVEGRCLVLAGEGIDLGPLPDGVTLETLPRPKDEGRPQRRPPRADAPPSISGIDFLDDVLVATLDDGRVLRVPVERSARLAAATEAQRSAYEISPLGAHWPEIDEDLSTESLIRMSAETEVPAPRSYPG